MGDNDDSWKNVLILFFSEEDVGDRVVFGEIVGYLRRSMLNKVSFLSSTQPKQEGFR